MTMVKEKEFVGAAHWLTYQSPIFSHIPISFLHIVSYQYYI